MLLSESAVDTLARNSLIGLLELLLDEVLELLVELVSCSTWARYVLASAVSPDLIEANRPVSAVSSELWPLLDVLEVDDVEEAESSAKSEEVLSRAEIDMASNPFPLDFPEQRPRQMDSAPRYRCG